MKVERPTHLMRLGIHADQVFFTARPDMYDIAVFNASIVEYTAKATASLLVGALAGRAYLIDPCTHAFGHAPRYVLGPADENGKQEPKKSIKGLAEAYGPPVDTRVGIEAVGPGHFSDRATRRRFVRSVIEFQLKRLGEALEEDAKYLDDTASIRSPECLIAPYFYMSLGDVGEWLDVNVSMLNEAREFCRDLRLFGEVLIDRGILENKAVLDEVCERFGRADCDGYLIWISDLSEHEAARSTLEGLRHLVRKLAESGHPVINMYGGYFSLLLSKSGLSGLCHGPGYGEERDVVPVGGGMPISKYYLTPIHRRLLFDDVLALVQRGTWRDVAQFKEEVCSGPTCGETLNDSLDSFTKFGEFVVKQDSKSRLYPVPTPAAKAAATFHFIEAKAQEFRAVCDGDLAQIREQLSSAAVRYKELDARWLRHLAIWGDVLGQA